MLLYADGGDEVGRGRPWYRRAGGWSAAGNMSPLHSTLFLSRLMVDSKEPNLHISVKFSDPDNAEIIFFSYLLFGHMWLDFPIL